MKGLEISFRGKTTAVSLESNAGAFIYQRNGYFHFTVSGLEKGEEMISSIWIDSDMELEESLDIEIKDINDSSDPLEKKIAFSGQNLTSQEEIEKMLKYKLDYYYTLEKLLKNEGLL
ncbi:MAG: hypothetical protein LBV43_06400 [Prevotella sp.]|jgi:hypothetical protein|nr:hypothetical protein [Prevotella sp.]